MINESELTAEVKKDGYVLIKGDEGVRAIGPSEIKKMLESDGTVVVR